MKSFTEEHRNVLSYINKVGETYAAQIMNAVKLTYYRTNKIVKELEEDGYIHSKMIVQSKPVSHKNILYMTAKGRNKLDELDGVTANPQKKTTGKSINQYGQEVKGYKDIPVTTEVITQKKPEPIDIEDIEHKMASIANNMQKTVIECTEILKNNLMPMLECMEKLEKMAKENDIINMPEFISTTRQATDDIIKRTAKDLEDIHLIGKKLSKKKLKATKIIMVGDEE